jgi:hypothetical protein
MGYTAPLIDKPIRLVGLSTSIPSSPGVTTKVGLNGVMRIRGIAQGDVCLVAGIKFNTIFVTAMQGCSIEDCPGTVILDGWEFRNFGYSNQSLRVERCSNVLLQGVDCTMAGSGWGVVDSHVSIQRSQFRVNSSTLIFPGAPPATATFSVLSLLRSSATLSTCTLAGHPAATGPYVFGPGRPAVLLDQSTLHIGPYTNLSQNQSSPPGYGALNPPQCLVRRDPRSLVVTAWGNPGLPLFIEPIHATTTSFSVIADEPYTVWVDGPSSGFALLGFDQLLPAPVATPFGELWLDPFRFTPVAILPLAATTGEGIWNDLCPAAAPIDEPFVFQSLTLAPNGTLGITLPSPFTVGWEYFRIP